MDRCQPCLEDECDVCHNCLWDAGCLCPHDRWPEPRCGARGKKADETRVFVCDAPRGRHRHRVNTRGQMVHEGRYWYIPNATDECNQWWGWKATPFTWTWRRVVSTPRAGFDPWDPTAPTIYDQTRRAS
jgi:hypothetical protein